MDTTARILKLISLLQTRRTWPGSELMGRLGISERTLRRDVERLRHLGYPVTATTGPTGGYQLGPGTDMPPLLLDEEEAVALAIGLRTAAGGTISGIAEASARALAKLEQVLPPKVRQQVGTYQKTVATLARPWVTVDSELLALVAGACRDNERIRFQYTARNGETSERNVEPHHVVSVQQRWYLLAFDRDRDDWRTFRLDRITQPWPTRMRFEPRSIPGGDPVDYVVTALGSAPLRYRLVALVHAPAEELADKVNEGELTPIDDSRCLFETQADYLDWLVFRLLWLDVDFEVQEPAELADRIRKLVSRMQRAVS